MWFAHGYIDRSSQYELSASCCNLFTLLLVWKPSRSSTSPRRVHSLAFFARPRMCFAAIRHSVGDQRMISVRKRILVEGKSTESTHRRRGPEARTPLQRWGYRRWLCRQSASRDIGPERTHFIYTLQQEVSIPTCRDWDGSRRCDSAYRSM